MNISRKISILLRSEKVIPKGFGYKMNNFYLDTKNRMATMTIPTLIT